MPPEYAQFLDLAEAGRWEEADALFTTLSKRERSETEQSTWYAIKEAYGVFYQTRKWPPEQLLAYGQAVLGSLKPDMVYLGGTDAGRFIPTLLNESGDGEKRVLLTQNAFADGSYMEYVRFLYGDRLNLPASHDSQRAFQSYLTDAQKRWYHDQQAPDEPAQLRRGEQIEQIESRIHVSGQTAVMAINELILKTLLEKNPNTTFALEESFSLPSTYAGAMPLGPLLELRSEAASTFTPELAAQSLEFFRSAAQSLASDPAATSSEEVRSAYSKMVAAQANLFASHKFEAEAEQGYRLALELAPNSLEPVSQFAEYLARNGRPAEAGQLLDQFAARNSNEAKKVQEERDYLAKLNGR